MKEGNQRHDAKEPGPRPTDRPDGTSYRSELSAALNRAGSAVSLTGSAGEEPEILREDAVIAASGVGPVSTVPTALRKVDVKYEVAGYIEHCFTCRTTEDGTILSVSKERLVEDVTRLLMELVERKNEEARAGR